MSRYEILRGIEKPVKPERDKEPVCAGITGIPESVWAGITGISEPQSVQDNRYAGYTGCTGRAVGYTGSTGYTGTYYGIAGITGIPEPDASSSISAAGSGWLSGSWSDASSNTINNSFYYYGDYRMLDSTVVMNETAKKDEIIFSVGDKEALRISSEGFFVENRQVTSDSEIYNHFKIWLEAQTNSNNGK